MFKSYETLLLEDKTTLPACEYHNISTAWVIINRLSIGVGLSSVVYPKNRLEIKQTFIFKMKVVLYKSSFSN